MVKKNVKKSWLSILVHVDVMWWKKIYLLRLKVRALKVMHQKSGWTILQKNFWVSGCYRIQMTPGTEHDLCLFENWVPCWESKIHDSTMSLLIRIITLLQYLLYSVDMQMHWSFFQLTISHTKLLLRVCVYSHIFKGICSCHMLFK